MSETVAEWCDWAMEEEVKQPSMGQAQFPASRMTWRRNASKSTKMADCFKNLVTIAIPAYNEERFLRDAVLSCVDQSNRIVIFDNASEDRTETICRELAAQYPNISGIRHAKNIGSWPNFKFALDAAETEYFMWLGAHDKLSTGYVEKLVAALAAIPDAALAFAPAKRVDCDDMHRFTYDYFLYSDLVESDNVFERLYGLMRFNDECSNLHGVYRTRILKDAWNYVPASLCAGCDLVLLAKVAALGRFVYVKGVEYIRRDIRDDDTLAAYLERIHPDNILKPNYYVEMVTEQIEVVAKVQEPNRIKKRFWQERIRFHLTRRYGFLKSGILWADALSASLYFAYRVRRKLLRMFGITPQNLLLKARRYPTK